MKSSVCTLTSLAVIEYERVLAPTANTRENIVGRQLQSYWDIFLPPFFLANNLSTTSAAIAGSHPGRVHVIPLEVPPRVIAKHLFLKTTLLLLRRLEDLFGC
jgi:hypothetical protein